MSSTRLARKALFARFRGGPTQIRPPWGLSGEAFTDACTQCGKCREACPVGAIVTGHAGYPIVDFARGGCTFCGACAEACEAGCFDRAAKPWDLAAVVSDACVESKGIACRICEEACGSAAIIFRPKLGGGSLPSISLCECTGCGACVASCPVDAISLAAPAHLEVPT